MKRRRKKLKVSIFSHMLLALKAFTFFYSFYCSSSTICFEFYKFYLNITTNKTSVRYILIFKKSESKIKKSLNKQDFY